jgi:hypothetical protein
MLYTIEYVWQIAQHHKIGQAFRQSVAHGIYYYYCPWFFDRPITILCLSWLVTTSPGFAYNKARSWKWAAVAHCDIQIPITHNFLSLSIANHQILAVWQQSCQARKMTMTKKVPPTDILISIYLKHVDNIVTQLKNHEYRKFLIPATVNRIWIYETAPMSAIRCWAIIGPGKRPGELAEDDLDGLDNRSFNNRETLQTRGSGSQFAYKILELYRLESGLRLETLKEKGWLKGAPQKHNFAPQDMVSELQPGLVKKF